MNDSNEQDTTLEKRIGKAAHSFKKKIAQEWLWQPDDNNNLLEKEVKRLYSNIYNKFTKYGEDKELGKIKEKMDETLDEIYLYEINKTNDCLHRAFKLLQSANSEMNDYTKTHPVEKDTYFIFLGVFLFYNLVIGGILHGTSMWWFKSSVFWVDLFFISAIGAFASSIVYLGTQGKPVIQEELITKLVVSPIVAVILIVILSGMNIGLETQTTAGVVTPIGSLTLVGQSDGIKWAFGFIFAFFGETAIEILRGFIRK